MLYFEIYEILKILPNISESVCLCAVGSLTWLDIFNYKVMNYVASATDGNELKLLGSKVSALHLWYQVSACLLMPLRGVLAVSMSDQQHTGATSHAIFLSPHLAIWVFCYPHVQPTYLEHTLDVTENSVVSAVLKLIFLFHKFLG